MLACELCGPSDKWTARANARLRVPLIKSVGFAIAAPTDPDINPERTFKGIPPLVSAPFDKEYKL